MLFLKVLTGLILLCVSTAVFAEQGTTTLATAIQARVEHLMFTADAHIDQVPILARDAIAELYVDREYQPLWPSAEKIQQLKPLVELAWSEGLDPADYPLDTVLALLANGGLPQNAAARADLDILATETLVRIGYQMRHGKVNPQELFSDWNFNRDLIEGQDRSHSIEQAVAADTLVEFVTSWVFRGPLYKQMKQALANYRELEKQGGWGTVAAGETLRPGDIDDRIPALRRRLRVTGDLSAGATGTGNSFDEELREAIVHFQDRHGLVADGIVGAKSLAALNVPIAARINQLRASLERGRWVMDEVSKYVGNFVLVNIASAQVALIRQGEARWISRVQVGKTYRQTPVFRGDIQYLVFNPTWTVPPTILRENVLPELKQDADGYLTRNHMDLLDRDGKSVDYTRIDWSKISVRNFPYIVRQRPGPWNSLGLVKFIFPNPHFVFLHDTPHREFFVRAERAFSSGCIRVEHPFELAELLLAQPDKWNNVSIQELVDTRQTRTIHLKEPMPVLILYWTGMADRDGTVRFYADIYGRDKVLLKSMNAPLALNLSNQE
jgi:murein L,D-transpeptidase YcbB/YkuD